MKRQNKKILERILEALDQAILLVDYARNNGFKYSDSQRDDLKCVKDVLKEGRVYIYEAS